MEKKPIDYQHPSTMTQHQLMLRIIILVIAISLLVGSIILCITTWVSARRLIFLPGGDVGQGIRSYAGWIEWIESAPWEKNSEHVQWSVPWLTAFIIEALIIACCLYRRR